MAAITAPMTIAEFERADLPENYELHHGEPVAMTLPRKIHRDVQWQAGHVLEREFPKAEVRIELTFRVDATNDERSADVGMTTRERGRTATKEGTVAGAPEVVVEVVSPSNTIGQMREYRRVCFENGTLVFLTLDPEEKTVVVHLKDPRSVRTWTMGEEFAIALWREERQIAVSDFFAVIE